MNLRTGLFLLVWALASCTGRIDVQGEPSGSGSPGGPVLGEGPNGEPLLDSSGPRAFTRLTPFEYVNTVRDVFGVTPPSRSIRSSVGVHGFEVAGEVTSADAMSMQEDAERIAAEVVKNLEAVAPCESGNEPACARSFLTTVGRRVFRRPLLDEEIASIEALYNLARTEWGYGYEDGIRVLIAAMLQSPPFIYHWEGTESAAPNADGLIPLSGFDLASRLSYFLWASTPDEELLSAAETGSLATADEVERQARRMLAHPHAQYAIPDVMLRQWLKTDDVRGVTKTDPLFEDGLTGAAMAMETRRFVTHVLFDGDRRLSTLFTADYSFVNDALAPIYGVSVEGSDLQRVTLPPGERAGLLTQGSFLALHSGAAETSPVKRGATILHDVLCQNTPPPPSDVPPLPPIDDQVRTMRERAELHASEPACSGCHAILDPLGFAFENYDSVARYRTMEGSLPVDASGVFTLGSAQHRFDGAVELSHLIASASETEECFARKFLRYVLGRKETASEYGSVLFPLQTLRESDGDLHELLVAITRSKSFRFRAPSEGEVFE